MAASGLPLEGEGPGSGDPLQPLLPRGLPGPLPPQGEDLPIPRPPPLRLLRASPLRPGQTLQRHSLIFRFDSIF